MKLTFGLCDVFHLFNLDTPSKEKLMDLIF